jgi:hypothetical protein
MFPYARAASPWRRVGILIGFAVAVAAITALVAGPVTGAVPTSQVWSLLPCFALVVASVALAAVGIQAVLGKAGTLLVAVAFIVVGGSGAGGAGVALLPTYWQHIGVVLPPRYAIEPRPHRPGPRRPGRWAAERRTLGAPGQVPCGGIRR